MSNIFEKVDEYERDRLNSDKFNDKEDSIKRQQEVE